MLSTAQIANLTVSSRSTIVAHLKRAGIALRDVSRSRQLRPGQVPFGKRLVKGRLIENKTEMEIIAHMRKLRNDGLSYWKIAELLNLWGVSTKTPNARWQAATVMKILRRIPPNTGQ